MSGKNKEKSITEILSSYYSQKNKIEELPKEVFDLLKTSKKDMKKATTSFESMLQIQKRLVTIYEELLSKK